MNQDILNTFSHEKNLHPLTLLYNLIINSPALVISLYYGIYQKNIGEWINVIITMLVIAIVILPAILLKYLFFKYKITNTEIIITNGILSKKNRLIPITKVQNINLTQNFLQKMLGLTKVQIETAGDIQSEAILELVSSEEAHSISTLIKLYQSNSEIKQEQNHLQNDNYLLTTSSNDNILFEMSFKEILLFGALRFRPLFLIIGFWIYSNIQQFYELNNYVNSFFEQNINNIATLDNLTLVLLAFSALITIIFISWLIDIVWTANTYYKFKLINEKNKLIIQSGLLNKQNTTIPFKKVQQISIISNILKERFGYYGLKLYTAGYGIKLKGSDLAVPNAKLEVIYEVIDKIKNYRIPNEFTQISKKSIRRAFVRYATLFVPIFAIIIYYELFIIIVLLFLIFLYYFAYLDWKNRGFYFDNNTLYLKYGILIKKINIISVNKIQVVKIRETFFQRRLGLASLILDTAAVTSEAETIIRDIDKRVAQELFNLINDKINININIYKKD